MKNNDKNILIIALAFGFVLCLTLSAFAQIPIYCPKCKTHLYNYQKEVENGAIVKAIDFKPASEDIKQPREQDPMVCPFDGAELNGWMYWYKQQGFKGFVLAYPAISLLSKDKDNKWIWLGDNMQYLDFNK